MASIQDALKNRTSYTTKHGLNIPYEELRNMKRLNDQLDYYKKKLGMPTGDRIKIGSLANDYVSKVRQTEQSVRIGKYIRIKKRIEKKPTTLLERRLKRLEYQIRRALKNNTKHDFNLDISLEDYDLFKGKKGERMDFGKLVNFKDNLIQTIYENFNGVLSDTNFQKLLDMINGLSAYELHRLATDNPTLLDYIYYDPEIVSHKLHQIISAVESASISPVDYSDFRNDIDEDIFYGEYTKHSKL